MGQLKEVNSNSSIDDRVDALVKKISEFTENNRHLEAVMALNDFLLQDVKNKNSSYYENAMPYKPALESSKRMLDQIKGKLEAGNAEGDMVMLNKRMIGTREQLMNIAIKLYDTELGGKINSGF